MRKYFLVMTFLLSGLTTLSPQEIIHLTLDEALMLARQQSLQAFLNQHYFMIDYWNYRNYRAYMLPSVSLQATPLRYFNISQLRYNSVTQTEEFIRTENLSSDMNLNISQRFAPTGGRFFVSSELGRIENFGRFSYTQFSSVPFSIGYRQDLFGFNEMKWLRKIEPLKFEKAKKEYLESVEDMHILTVRYFFDVVRAGINKGVYKIATSQQQIAEIAAQQRIQQFEQNAITSAVSFNIRKSRVKSAALSDTLASESYELTMVRFRGGGVNVLQLTSSQAARDRARLQFINALSGYWMSYYSLRRLTLYDFEKDRKIEFREEELFR